MTDLIDIARRNGFEATARIGLEQPPVKFENFKKQFLYFATKVDGLQYEYKGLPFKVDQLTIYGDWQDKVEWAIHTGQEFPDWHFFYQRYSSSMLVIYTQTDCRTLDDLIKHSYKTAEAVEAWLMLVPKERQ